MLQQCCFFQSLNAFFTEDGRAMHRAPNPLTACPPLPQAGRLPRPIGFPTCRSSVGAAPRTVAAAAAAQETPQLRTVALTAEEISRGNFQPFGQLVGPTDDGAVFGVGDAHLNLANGTPRFYIMRLPRRGRQFHRITYHKQVTQCLGGLQPGHWYLVVAKPTMSLAQYPQEQDLKAFRIPHGVFVKLDEGTWHAGPLFDDEFRDFYNLELADTNVTDHNTHDYAKHDGLAFLIVD